MKVLLKPLQWLYTIYALLLFVALMLLVVPFVIIASFFGRIKGGNIIYKLCKVWGLIWYFLIGVWHKNIYEVPHDKNKQYIFVANHSSYMDIPPVVVAFNQPLRILAKYELSKIPVFGYIYKTAAILVDRRDAEKRAQSVRQLKAVLRKRVSIFIFPEGTFNETDKPLKDFYDGAFRIAIETQTPIKPVLLLDTINRLHYSSIFSLTPGKSRAVFMEEIPVTGLQTKDIAALKQTVHSKMEEGLLRYRGHKVKSVNLRDTNGNK
jgi:1-acyl-sn-glycerol-3-phosphate acyltransferase